MLKNLFLVTWRSLARNKFYSFINIFGLSVGIASCLIIWMYVDHQLSFDRFHENVDDIYRVIRIQGPDKNREHAGVSEARCCSEMVNFRRGTTWVNNRSRLGAI